MVVKYRNSQNVNLSWSFVCLTGLLVIGSCYPGWWTKCVSTTSRLQRLRRWPRIQTRSSRRRECCPPQTSIPDSRSGWEETQKIQRPETTLQRPRLPLQIPDPAIIRRLLRRILASLCRGLTLSLKTECSKIKETRFLITFFIHLSI